MDEIKKITKNHFEELAAVKGFTMPLLLKDYYITLILFLIKDVRGIYFKGGTALNKIFLKHARLSEDLDFSIIKDEKQVKEEISDIINNSGFFKDISYGKRVEGFTRIIIKYKSELGEGEIFIDLNKRASVLLKPEVHKITHFYAPFIPEFSVKTIAKEEMIAEKVKAAMTRNKPRDHYDLYKIIKNNLPLNLKLAEKKCKEAKEDFSILRMFNKAKTLKNRWDKDMGSLISEKISFQEVIKFLAEHFKLKEEKEKIKQQR